MVGIKSCSVYIPFSRLNRSEITKSWGKSLLKGEKAVANYDEDSITMAVNAGIYCKIDMDDESIDGLYFASTTFPYREKQSAAIIAAALDLRRDIFTADFSGSLRGSTCAMRAAVDAINSNSAKNILVCIADMRLGAPQGSSEIDFGDGAASLLIGDTGVFAAIEGSHCIFNEFIDTWRTQSNVFVLSAEDRFVREKGYINILTEAVSMALKKYHLTPKDFSKVVFYSPNPKSLIHLSRDLGFDPARQLQDSLYDLVGNTGTALGPMMLVATFKQAKVGDRILFASYGDGCDVYIFRITEEMERIRERIDVQAQLQSKQEISYQKYLRWRNIIPVEPPTRPPLEKPSPVALWRDSKRGLALFGSKCKICETPQYPAQRVCIQCYTKDQFEDYCFADKKGRLITFSHDNLAATIDPPATIATVDFDEGGRILCEMTDRDPEKIEVGMPIKMTFRIVRYSGGIYDYWWKCRPLNS
jgi:3-hydroxy-3-methylglutaryl CoA synthase/uncharacterized OB-fold protein